MRNRRNLITLSAAIAWSFAGTSLATAQTSVRVFESYEILPTRSILELPAYDLGSVLSTSTFRAASPYATSYLVEPTSTTVPVTYLPSSTVMYPAQYVYRPYRRRLFERPVYLAPTPYVLRPGGVVTTTQVRAVSTLADCCCPSSSSSSPATSAPSAARSSVPTEAVVRENSPSFGTGRTKELTSSAVSSDPTMDDDAARAVREDRLKTMPTGGVDSTAGSRQALPGISEGGAGAGPASSAVDSTATPKRPLDKVGTSPALTIPPPTPTPVTRPTPAGVDTGTTKKRTTPAETLPSPPAPPEFDPLDPRPARSGSDSLPPGPLPRDEVSRRNAMRPSALSTVPLKNVLRGQVVSAESRLPEEGVQVVLTDPGQRLVDRRVATDADGRFAVTLPEGEWAIKLTMPSGRTLAVGQGVVTANSGKVNDMYGRELKTLVIQR